MRGRNDAVNALFRRITLKRRYMGIAAAVMLAGAAGCNKGQTRLNSARVVSFAQPAVVMIQDFGDMEVNGPTGAETRKQYEHVYTPTYPTYRPRTLSEILNGTSTTPSWRRDYSTYAPPPPPSLVS